ncbi:MAG: bifunctional DNA primase/polymerase [Planctomycetota bacterium]
MSATSPMLQAALWYADQGYPVFPCAPGRKTPLTEHGLLDATIDADQIEAWWTQSPGANLGLRTDGLVVIDVDGADNVWLHDHPERLAQLAMAPTSLTPRGGRQYIFRQPEGRCWRNTAGQLAHRVDTRADGGYVVVAPSVVAGTAYRWLDGLDLPAPEKLDPPPDWLVALLDRMAPRDAATSTAPASETAIPAGQRNATLARLAGAMRRVGMSQAEILAALLRVNIDRCHPPLHQREVERIAASIARYAPDSISVALIEDHYGQDRQQPASGPSPVRDLVKLHFLRKPVIHGLLRRGETMNVIAAPKTGKSWLVLGQAMAIATGRPWLGLFPAERGRVLILDNELHPETIAHRIPQVAAALGIGMDEIADQIYVHPLRGQLRDILAMATYFDAIEPGQYAAIILDAMYRFMPAGADENDNGAMAGIYNRLDAYAERLGCCFIAIHHTTKGNQSAKSVTDVGAGAGSQSRAADAHLVLRPHEEPGAVVLEAVVRSWAPVTPIALQWEFPVWRPAPALDPAALRSERPKRATTSRNEEPDPPDWSIETFVQTFIGTQPVTIPELREQTAREPGLSWRRISDLLALAEQRGLIQRVRLPGRGGPQGFVIGMEEVQT